MARLGPLYIPSSATSKMMLSQRYLVTFFSGFAVVVLSVSDERALLAKTRNGRRSFQLVWLLPAPPGRKPASTSATDTVLPVEDLGLGMQLPVAGACDWEEDS